MRFFGAMAAAQIAERRTAGEVDVFEEVAGVVQTTGAEIDGEHHLDAGHLRPVGEFIDADLVGFLGAPGEIKTDGTLVARPNTVFPAIGRNEVSARITDVRDLQVLHEFQNVLAKAVFIRLRMARLVDAAVYGAPHMFDEGGIKTIVDTPNPEVPVD